MVINGKEVDLEKALPLTLGDLEELQKQDLELIVRDGKLSFSKLIDTFTYILRKGNPDITRDDVKTLNPKHEAMLALNKAISGKDAEERLDPN